MNTTRKCPQCGSDAHVGNEYYFKCGNKGEGDFTTAVCLERRCELLSNRVKELEELIGPLKAPAGTPPELTIKLVDALYRPDSGIPLDHPTS